MKSSVETVSPVERKIHVEIEPERVAQELDSAYRSLSRQVRIEGFRPGKAPRHVLERRFKQQVELDVAQNLIERTWRDAVKEQKLDVVAPPRVDDLPLLKIGQPFSYDARVEIRPVIEPKDYAGIPVKRGKHAVGTAEVEAELEKLRKGFAERKPITGRNAQKGDFAVIDFEALIDGQPFPGNKGEGTTVEVAEGDFVKGQVGQIEGMAVGSQKTIDYKFPDDFRIAEAAGKNAKLTFTLKELQENVLPALDDKLAKDAGLGDTVDAMRAKIDEILKANAKGEKDKETRAAIIAGLIAKNPFDCPKAMVERGVDAMLEGGIERMQQQGIDVRQLGLDLEKLRGDLRPKAEEEVRGTLLLDAIAKKENVEATEAEFQARLEDLAKENGIPLDKVQQAFKRVDQREGLMMRLREEKTIAFLESKAQIEET